MRRSSFLLLSFALAGCELTPGGPGNDPCAPLLAECIGKQQACVVSGGAAQCEPCAVGEYAAPSTGACTAIPGNPLSNDFADFTIGSGEEVLGLCQSWTLNNPEEIWVNAVELTQDVASHHSNWMFVPDDLYPGADGVWPCAERNYHQLDAALAGGVLYAQSTQAAHEVQKFPDGAAIRIPPYSRVIGDVHLLNTTQEAITGHAKLSIYELPLADVEVRLTPFHLTYDGLHIPPHASSRFTGECAVAMDFPNDYLGMELYFVLPHTHAMAKRFFFEAMGGAHDGQTLVEVNGFDGEAHGVAFDPPIDLKDGTGYRFGCEYDNPRDEYVDWGFGDQEMCELLGFAKSAYGFESSIDEAVPDGSDGMTQLFTGACSTFAFPWSFDSPGGPGPM